jgi:pyridoxal phosphate enzyme (YggS family)
MTSIAENLALVREQMAAAAKRSGRSPEDVVLVAVSKTRTLEVIKQAAAAGQMDFGENYAQELRDKMRDLADPAVRWHFIGHLQKNKVKYVAGKVAEFHSLDGLELAKEINKRAGKQGAAVKAMLEVNLGGEATKSGVEPEQAALEAAAINRLMHVELIGLMTMPPYDPDPEKARPYYTRLREMRDEIRKQLGEPGALPELSMGLSHDFEVAIEEGATRIRVGTAIFGERE